MAELISSKGKEEFYQKLRFRIHPNEKEENEMMINMTLYLLGEDTQNYINMI